MDIITVDFRIASQRESFYILVKNKDGQYQPVNTEGVRHIKEMLEKYLEVKA